MGVGRIFSRGGSIGDSSRHSQKYFFRGGQKWQNFILPLETKKTAFFAKNLIGKYQISNSGGALALT